MTNAAILLRAYYERLHERLENARDELARQVARFLTEEWSRRGHACDPEAFAAYREACQAFVEERLEAYNPIGIQYTFDQRDKALAHELELQLDWFDSRAEFTSLRAAARRKAFEGMDDGQVHFLADELIIEQGAFPNGSIIRGYDSDPALNKLPDYIVALAINRILGITSP